MKYNKNAEAEHKQEKEKNEWARPKNLGRVTHTQYDLKKNKKEIKTIYLGYNNKNYARDG